MVTEIPSSTSVWSTGTDNPLVSIPLSSSIICLDGSTLKIRLVILTALTHFAMNIANSCKSFNASLATSSV